MLNHPEVIIRSWRRSLIPREPETHRAASGKPRMTGNSHSLAVHWPQGMIRRAADAMRESASQDWFCLARAALEAAIHDQNDLAACVGTIAATSTSGVQDR